jgi:hypothetical protein
VDAREVSTGRMKKTKKAKKQRHYIIEVVIEQTFNALQDVDADSLEEAIKAATKSALRHGATDDEVWAMIDQPTVVSTSVEAEYSND